MLGWLQLFHEVSELMKHHYNLTISTALQGKFSALTFIVHMQLKECKECFQALPVC